MESIGMRLSIAAHITGIKVGSCQVKKCPTSPANVKAKINEGEEAKKSKAAINEKDMMFMEFLNLVLKLQLL